MHLLEGSTGLYFCQENQNPEKFAIAIDDVRSCEKKLTFVHHFLQTW